MSTLVGVVGTQDGVGITAEEIASRGGAIKYVITSGIAHSVLRIH